MSGAVTALDSVNASSSSSSPGSASSLKDLGNSCLLRCRYSEACSHYTASLDLSQSAIVYANRSMAYIKMEQYGLAIADADKAVEIDPEYVKGYYRRGSALFALGKNKEAKKDFKTVCKMRPKDRDARNKLMAVQKAVNERKFAEAIESEETAPLSETLDVDGISIDYDKYEGPHPSPSSSSERCGGGEVGASIEGANDAESPPSSISSEEALFSPNSLPLTFVMDVINGFKVGKLVHRRYVARVLLSCINHFRTLSSLVDVAVPDRDGKGEEGEGHVTVCGDTHGQFYDVIKIFEMNGYPSSSNPYVFNGDYVDRGSWGVEVALMLFMFKMHDTSCVHLTRGNHETKNMNKIYGFEGEVKHKYDATIFGLFLEAFSWLPLGAVLEGKVIVVHGGLCSEDGVTLEDIRRIKRGREPPEGGMFSDLLWSDPQPFPGRSPSKRGVGYSFGPDVTSSFLTLNGLTLLVRSHEVKDEGYVVEHGGKCVTIFSAPNYCDSMGNKGAFIRFKKDVKPEFVKFEHSEHPDVKPMAYAAGMGGLMGL